MAHHSTTPWRLTMLHDQHMQLQCTSQVASFKCPATICCVQHSYSRTVLYRAVLCCAVPLAALWVCTLMTPRSHLRRSVGPPWPTSSSRAAPLQILKVLCTWGYSGGLGEGYRGERPGPASCPILYGLNLKCRASIHNQLNISLTMGFCP